MEVFGLKISEMIEGTEGSFMNVNGITIKINNYLKEIDAKLKLNSNNINSISNFNAVATCNQVCINKDGIEQELLKYILEDETRTLLVTRNELEKLFIN